MSPVVPIASISKMSAVPPLLVEELTPAPIASALSPPATMAALLAAKATPWKIEVAADFE
jgi:hypothetical protein